MVYSYETLTPPPAYICQYNFVHNFAGTLDTAINLISLDIGQRSRVVGSKVTPTITRPSVDGLITTKESLRFPEMPALPPLVSTYAS